MKTKATILTILFTFLFAAHCRQEPQTPKRFGTPSAVVAKELKRRRELIAGRIKDRYDIKNTRSSRDAIIRAFVRATAAGDLKRARSLVFNREEYENILWPNLPDTFTMNHGMSPERASSLAMMKRDMGLSRLITRLRGKRIRLKQIEWKSEKRVYNALIGHRPWRIVVEIDGRERVLEQIRMVIEHRGRFKIAVVTAG